MIACAFGDGEWSATNARLEIFDISNSLTLPWILIYPNLIRIYERELKQFQLNLEEPYVLNSRYLEVFSWSIIVDP